METREGLFSPEWLLIVRKGVGRRGGGMEVIVRVASRLLPRINELCYRGNTAARQGCKG